MQQNDGAEKWWISGMAEYPKKTRNAFFYETNRFQVTVRLFTERPERRG